MLERSLMYYLRFTVCKILPFNGLWPLQKNNVELELIVRLLACLYDQFFAVAYCFN